MNILNFHSPAFPAIMFILLREPNSTRIMMFTCYLMCDMRFWKFSLYESIYCTLFLHYPISPSPASFSLSDASSVPKLYSIINHTLDHVSLVFLNCRTSWTFTCVCPRYYLNTYVIVYEHKFKYFTLSRVPFSYLILCRSFSLMSK